MHRMTMLSLTCLLASCATHDPGWRGTDAEPFDRAKATCDAEVDGLPHAEREAALEACMARRGWTR